MPNYSLVLDTKFKPFSYQEMLAPVMAATQAHQAIEEEYGSLAQKASVWEEMANKQTDPYAYKMYKTYSNDLEARAEQLLRYGLSPSSRKGMLDMRARYSKEIVPIEAAYKRREELAAEQRKAMAADPTLRYQRMASQMSLDDFIRNPSLDYGRSYSGALLTKQVSQAVANYAKVLTDEGKLESLGLPFQYKQRIKRGASPSDILAVITEAAKEGNMGAIKFLKASRDLVLKSSGVADWATKSTMAEFTDFANLGLYSAIGQDEIKTYTDQYGASLASARSTGTRGRREEDSDLLPLNPKSLYSQNSKYNPDADLLLPNRAHITKSGKAVGMKALNNIQKQANRINTLLTEDIKSDPYGGAGKLQQTYKELISNLEQGKPLTSDQRNLVKSSGDAGVLFYNMVQNMGYNNAIKWVNTNLVDGNYTNDAVKEQAYNYIYGNNITASATSPGNYDAVKNTVWGVDLSSESLKELKNKMSGKINHAHKITLGRDGSVQSNTPSSLSSEEFNDAILSDYQLYRDPNTGISYPHVRVTTKDGKKSELIDLNSLDINPVRGARIQEALNNAAAFAEQYEEALQEKDWDKVMLAKQFYKEALEQANLDATQYAGTLKVKDYIINYTDY